MKTKTVKRYIYEGLGFPVVLLNVPFVQAAGVWTPAIDYIKLQEEVLLALSHKPFPLTGSEIHFIRIYFEMRVEQFAALFTLTKSEVLQCERRRLRPAKISPNTELCIRLFILDKLKVGNQIFRDAFRDFDAQQIAKEQKSPPKLQKPLLFPSTLFAKKASTLRV